MKDEVESELVRTAFWVSGDDRASCNEIISKVAAGATILEDVSRRGKTRLERAIADLLTDRSV